MRANKLHFRLVATKIETYLPQYQLPFIFARPVVVPRPERHYGQQNTFGRKRGSDLFDQDKAREFG